MKMIILFLALLFLYSCSERANQYVMPVKPNDTITQNKPDTIKLCPLPVQFTDPNVAPMGAHFIWRIFPDGSKLFFSISDNNSKILDLRTLQVTKFDYKKSFPDNLKIVLSGIPIFWCPYDNSRFATTAITATDTVGDGKNYISGNQLIIYSLNGSPPEIITPKFFGSAGAIYSFGCDGWIPSSTKGNDKFLIGYTTSYYGKSKYNIYCPQTQTLQVPDYKSVRAYSDDGKYYFCKVDAPYAPNYLRIFINSIEMFFKDADMARIGNGNFSPNGKYLAVSADISILDSGKPLDKQRLNEVWIIDVEQFMQNPVNPVPVKIINAKEKFCMFSYGMCPYFTSDSTLAVSMFRNGDTFCYLWEITTDGRLIRQLTFSP